MQNWSLACLQKMIQSTKMNAGMRRKSKSKLVTFLSAQQIGFGGFAKYREINLPRLLCLETRRQNSNPGSSIF